MNKIKKIFSSNVRNIATNVSINKKFILITCAFVAIGLCLAIGNIDTEKTTQSIIIQFKEGNFNIILCEVKFIIYNLLIISISYVFSFNFYIFLLTFIEISIASYLYFSYIINTILNDIFFGLISFFTILLPIGILIIIGMSIFISKICNLIKYPPCKKLLYIIPFKTHIVYVKNILKGYFLSVILPCFIWLNIAIVILYFIF